MFEPPEEKNQARASRLRIGAYIVVVLLALATLLYVLSRPRAKAPAPAPSPAAATIAGEADPVRDLTVPYAKMGKDRVGACAIWSIGLRNKSKVFTYTNIEYETTYIGADDRVLLLNKGTIKTDLEPDEQKDVPDFCDALYPTGTAWYKFRVTGAAAKAR